MLVKLYELPERSPAPKSVDLRRALAGEKHHVISWVRKRWGDGWASECEVAFAREPIACLLAVEGKDVLGFAVYDVAARGVFGPIGVDEMARRRGVGTALLLETLHLMRVLGYAYAIVGWVGPAQWYERAAGATLIPDSEPGMFRGMLRG